MMYTEGDSLWTLSGFAPGKASEELVQAILAVLGDPGIGGRIDREFLEVGAFRFDLYRGQVFSLYQEKLHSESFGSNPIVTKAVPILGLSWNQRRRLRNAVSIRASQVIAQSLRELTLERAA